MTALFSNLSTEGLEEAQDRLGGSWVRDTDIYTGIVKAMYAGASDSGAQNVTVLVDMEDGREYRETIYVTDRSGKNFFLNKQDKSKKVPLPGFTVIDDICLVTTGEPLCNQATEEKVVNVYDRDAGREIPKAVQMLTGPLGQPVTLGIVRVLENKSVKQGNEYVPTADTREFNTIDKVFHTETKMTCVEARNGAENATYHDSWQERNKGQTRDKRTIKDGEAGQAGRPGAPKAAPQAGQSAGARKSLFGKAA